MPCPTCGGPTDEDFAADAEILANLEADFAESALLAAEAEFDSAALLADAGDDLEAPQLEDLAPEAPAAELEAAAVGPLTVEVLAELLRRRGWTVIPPGAKP